jgi:hypothetical protein
MSAVNRLNLRLQRVQWRAEAPKLEILAVHR